MLHKWWSEAGRHQTTRILQILAYLVPNVANVFKFGLVCEIDEAEDYLSGNGHIELINDVDGNNMRVKMLKNGVSWMASISPSGTWPGELNAIVLQVARAKEMGTRVVQL